MKIITNPFTGQTLVDNSFCPTGKGGGVDPSCGAGNKDGVQRVSDEIVSMGLADKVNLSGMTADEARATATALQASLDVGGTKLKLRSIEVVDKMRVGGDIGGLGYSNGHIQITKRFLESARSNDPEAVKKMLEGTGGERNFGWQAGNTAVDSVALAVAHEVGHHVDTALFLDLGKGMRTVGKIDESQIVKVSGYASTHPAELFAEVHSFMSMGRSELVPNDVQKYYKAALATSTDSMFLR